MLAAHEHSEVRCSKHDAMGPRAQPHSPWILYFDGATRDSGGNPAGIGAVLKNGRGHTVVELKKLVGSGVSSAAVKYKALIAGLKKALSLGVEYLLVKGDSRLVHSQVVGHCSVQDDRLVEYQRKVMSLSRDFRALFVERISREDNIRADQLANNAIDEELQIVDSLSEFIDQEWTSHEKHASQQHSIHPHTHVHSHPHTHPLPLPAPHLKVKPVASVSPHVVKQHIVPATENHRSSATKSDDDSPVMRGGSRLFCSDEEGAVKVGECRSLMRNHSQHVQAAARFRRRPGSRRLFSDSPTKRPATCATLLPRMPQMDSLDSQMDALSFSDESTGASQVEASLQHGEGNSSGSCTADQVGCLPRNDDGFEVMSGTSDDSLSDADLSEVDYERLVKALLKGYFHRIKPSRS